MTSNGDSDDTSTVEAFLDWLQEVTHAIKPDRLWTWRREINDLDDQEIFHLKGLVSGAVITRAEVAPRSFSLTHLLRLARQVRFPQGRPELPGDVTCDFCGGTGLMRVISSIVWTVEGTKWFPWDVVLDEAWPEGHQARVTGAVVHCPCAWPGARRPRLGHVATTGEREGWRIWYQPNVKHNLFLADVMTMVDLLEAEELYDERLYQRWAPRVYRERGKPLPDWLCEPEPEPTPLPEVAPVKKRRPPKPKKRRAPAPDW